MQYDIGKYSNKASRLQNWKKRIRSVYFRNGIWSRMHNDGDWNLFSTAFKKTRLEIEEEWHWQVPWKNAQSLNTFGEYKGSTTGHQITIECSVPQFFTKALASQKNQLILSLQYFIKEHWLSLLHSWGEPKWVPHWMQVVSVCLYSYIIP